MAVNISPLCFLVLYISGTYSSGVNKLSDQTGEIKIEVLYEEQSNNKASSEYKLSNENISSIANPEDVGPIRTDKERESQFVTNNSSGVVLISSQDPSNKVHQHFIQIPNISTDKTTLDKTTPFVSKTISDTAEKSHLPGVFSTTTDSVSSLKRVTSSRVDTSDSMGASSQYSIQTKDKTPHNSITSDKATSSDSSSRSETTLISHSVSNIPGAVPSSTDSPTSLTNVTHSTVDKPSTMHNMEGSSKDSYALYSSTDVSFSQSTALTSATPDTPKRLLNTQKTPKVVIILAAIGGSLLVIVALLVYLKYRKKTGALPPEYLLLSP